VLKPVIAAGTAPRSASAHMQLAMDIRIASEAARFGFVFSQRGIVPERLELVLAAHLGISQALEWCYTGRVFPAQEALAGRLVSKVVPPDQLLPTAHALAREIAAKTAPVSVALIRQMMWRMLAPTIRWKPTRSTAAASTPAAAPDVKEGVVAFLEKRPAVSRTRCRPNMPDYFPWWTSGEYE